MYVHDIDVDIGLIMSAVISIPYPGKILLSDFIDQFIMELKNESDVVEGVVQAPSRMGPGSSKRKPWTQRIPSQLHAVYAV